MVWVASLFAFGMAILAVEGPGWWRLLWQYFRKRFRGNWREGGYALIFIKGTSLVFLVGGISWAVVGVKNYTLVVAAGLFFFLVLWRSVALAEKSLAYQQEAYQFLQSLHGLMVGGLSFFSATWTLVHRLNSKFSERVRRKVKGYKQGTSFSTCYETVLQQFPEGNLKLTFLLLEQAHQRGLSGVKLLKQSLPQLAHELSMAHQNFQLRKQISIQMALISFLPWGLNFFLEWMQPEIIVGGLANNSIRSGLLTMACVAWEGVGCWLLFQAIRFREPSERYQLFQKVQGLVLYIAAGVEPNYAWKSLTGGSFTDTIHQFHNTRYRLWLEHLTSLSGQGAPLQDSLHALFDELAEERKLAFQNHCRNLPTKFNLGMLLVFFPPTLGLLFLPLWAYLQTAF